VSRFVILAASVLRYRAENRHPIQRNKGKNLPATTVGVGN